MNKIAINVVSSDTLKELLNDITTMVADVLSHTFGPYGQSTLVQTVSSVYSTKDGWNVMQNLRITDEKGGYSVATNAIKKLIQDVAQSVVLNAGDGTTTSILAAASLNTEIGDYLKEHHLDSRTIENILKEVTSMVLDELQARATIIDDSNMEKIIYQIARISTNWDDEISGIIRDIYMKTNNPIIKVDDSGTLDTYAEYIEGYDIIGSLQLPNYYLTSPAKGLFEATNPVILTFGSALHGHHFRPLAYIGELLNGQNETLVILAPTFDVDFINHMKATNGMRVKSGQRPVNVVPFQYFAKTEIDKDCVEDFAVLTGSTVLTDQYEEVNKLFESLADCMDTNAKSVGTNKPEKDVTALIGESIEALFSICGRCEKLVATDKYILASGLTNKNTEEFERRKGKLENELFIKYKQSNAESSLTDSIRVKRLRLGKMQCNMGIIRVGGFGAAHLKAKKDAIDDATRACEVAYQDGFIVDGGIAIPLAIKSARDKLLEPYKGQSINASETFIALLDFFDLFNNAFLNVTTTLFNNRYNDITKSKSIAKECVDKETCYNLITEEYDGSLITPVNVCKEVLNGCLRLVLINATSNQFVFQNEDDLIRAIQAGSANNDEYKEDKDK